MHSVPRSYRCQNVSLPQIEPPAKPLHETVFALVGTDSAVALGERVTGSS